MSRLMIKDIKGKFIATMICAIIWYCEIIQYRFVVIRNMLLVLGVLMVFAIALDLSKRKIAKLRYLSKDVWLLGAYLGGTFLAGMLVAPVLSEHISHGISALEYYIVLLGICYYAITRKNVTFLAWNYVIMYAFAVILFLSSPQAIQEGGELRYSLSASMNSNIFAMSLTISIWAALYLVSLNKLHVIVGAVYSFAALYAIMMTASRKGLIGAILVVGLWVIMCYLPLQQRKRLQTSLVKYTVIAIGIMMAALILLPYYQSSYLFERMLGLVNLSDQSTINRLQMYVNGWGHLMDSPLLGYGFWGYSNFHFAYSHATIVEVPVSSGVFLSIVYFSTYIITAQQLWKRRKGRNIPDSRLVYISKVDNRVAMVLFALLLFYAFSLIHIYQLTSFVAFALVYSINGIDQLNGQRRK